MSAFDSIQVKNENDIIFNTIQCGVTVADMQPVNGFFAPAGELFFIAAFPGPGVRFKELEFCPYDVLSFFLEDSQGMPGAHPQFW